MWPEASERFGWTKTGISTVTFFIVKKLSSVLKDALDIALTRLWLDTILLLRILEKSEIP